ncbi:MAG: hypothetical protein J6Q55_02985, partial [Clostridia bacterium]|nr:hypothetical protein [Clostridia bacterium]
GQVVGYYIYFANNAESLELDVDTSCITTDYRHVYVASTNNAYTDESGKLINLKPDQVARVACQYYTLPQAIAKANEIGEEVVLIADATLTAALTINSNVVIDLNNKTLDIDAATLYVVESAVEIKNGTIDVTGVVAKGDCIIGVGNYSKDGTLTLTNVDVVGNGYSSAYAVFYVYGQSKLFLDGCTVNLANDTAGAGGAFKSETATGTTIKFTNSQVSLKDAKIGFLNGNVTFEESTLTIEGGKNAINGSVLTLINSEVEIFGSDERGITVTNGDVTIINSTVDIHDMAEASIRFKADYTLAVEGKSDVSVESIIVDSATNATYEQLVSVDKYSSFTHFELTVDGTVYTSALVGLSKAQDNSVVLLHSDIELPMALTLNKDVTLYGNGYVITGTGEYAMAVVDNANVTIYDLAIDASVTAVLVKGDAKLTLSECQVDANVLVTFQGEGAILVVDDTTTVDANVSGGVKAVVAGKSIYAHDLATLLAYLGSDYNQVEIYLYENQIMQEVAITVAKDLDLTINLNGYNIVGTNTVAGQFMFVNNGSLTIVGKGTINYTYTGTPDASYGKGNGTISNRGTLYVKDAMLINSTPKMSHSLNVIDNNSTIGDATSTLENATVLATETGIAVRLFANSQTFANSVVVMGTTEISGPAAMQIMLPSSNNQTRKASVTIQDSAVIRSTTKDGFAL